MMKKFFLYPIATLAIMLGSCNNQLDEDIQKLSSQQVITAKISENQSRTTTEGVKVLWSEGDQIGVIRTASEINVSQYVDNPFTLSSGQGTQSATFTANSSQGIANVVAYYPYRENTVYDGKITVNIPAEQFYDDGNQMLMVGAFESGSTSVAFKNAMALAVITVKNIPADYTKAVLSAANNEYLAGTATVTLGNSVSMQINADAQPSNKLTVNFGDNTDTEKRFYFAIPAGTYTNGLTMTLEGENCEPLSVGTLKDDNNSQQFTPAVNEFVDHTVTLDDEVSAVQMVASVQDLKDALAEGGSVKLSQGIDLNENLSISDDTSIDLNGQNLNMGSSMIEVAEGKSLTLTNSSTAAYSGRATETTVGINSSSDIIKASNGSTITIGEGVNLTTTGSGSSCIWIPRYAENVTVITAGNLKATNAGAAVISHNGYLTSGTINVTGGSVIHEADVAIYIAGNAGLTISGGAEIKGTTGVEIRAGSLTVENAIITATGNPLTATPNGNGTTTVGAAIAISQHTTDKAITATIQNGTFNGVYALYEADLQAEDKVATDVNLSVAGGTFEGEVYSASCSYFISGGTFTRASAFDYLADNAKVLMGDDMEIEKAIKIPVDITATINLNGKKITAPNTDAFEVQGTLTVDGDEYSIVTAGSSGNAGSVSAIWANGGTVTIEGGYYKVHADKDGKRNDCIYAGYNADNENTAGKVTINGGKFEFVWKNDVEKKFTNEYNGDWFLLNCADKDAYQTQITVNGGEFKNHVPSYEDVTPAGREGKEVQLGEGKVVYKSTEIVTTAHGHGESDDEWYIVKAQE